MSEGMVADFMTFPVNTLGQAAEFLGLDSDQKKRSRDMFAFEDIENFRRPLRIGSVVKGHGKLVLAEAVACHAIGLGEALEGFAVNEASLRIDAKVARAIGRPRFDVQYLAVTLHIDVLTRRNVFQAIGGIGFSGDVPDTPERAIFRA